MRRSRRDDPAVQEFESVDEWESWLSNYHAESTGVWMRMFKKSSGILSIRNTDALDVALCYGWITGQSRPYDELSWLDRYVPRRCLPRGTGGLGRSRS